MLPYASEIIKLLLIFGLAPKDEYPSDAKHLIPLEFGEASFHSMGNMGAARLRQSSSLDMAGQQRTGERTKVL